MFDSIHIYIAAVFILAGFVKGIIGLGLPTISMGLLAVVMPPIEAAALLILPSLLTNVWQMLAGPSLRSVVGRLWTMMVGVCLGTWVGLGLMTGSYARYGATLLGGALVAYAATGLRATHFAIPREREVVLGPLVGAVTGFLSAATGVFAIPAVPYLQMIGLEKEGLVQALGLSFTVSTIALGVNVWLAGALNVGMAGTTFAALAFSCFGMWIGTVLRLRLPAVVFRRCFFVGLALLGIYLASRSLI
jgi:uncharacterized membrane protein YfcA